MSASTKPKGLLPDNSEALRKGYRPAWAAATEEPEIVSEEIVAEEPQEEFVEEIQATLQKTAFGDYIAQVPLSDGQYATIGVQQTKMKDSFDKASDARASRRAHAGMTANLVKRIVLSVLAMAVIAVVASVIGTALINDITIKEAIDVFIQGLPNIFGKEG